MTARRALGRSSAAVVAAVLAACGGGAQLLSSGADEADAGGASVGAGEGGRAGERGEVSTDAADARDDAADGSTPVVVACPPPSDPYWDGKFDASPRYDGPLCGAIKGGTNMGYEGTGQVRGDLACAMIAHGPTRETCPTAICTAMDYSNCQPEVAPASALDDAGNCLLTAGAPYNVTCVFGGRRPDGFVAAPRRCPGVLGALFARQAELEAASVVAFERLAFELRELGAPEELSEACLVAAAEEERHSAQIGALAVRFGGRPTMPAVVAARPRSLLAMALENATEGVVNETFAAAVAVHQARRASDLAVREVLGRVAGDELGHSELARAVHAWALTKLSSDDVRALKKAVRDAADRLHANLGDAGPLEEATSRIAGWPAPEVGRAIALRLDVTLWRDEAA